MSNFFDKEPQSCHGCACMSSLFCLLNPDELTLVDANKINVNFKAGETIKKQGTYMSHVLSVNSGLAKLYLEGIEGRSAILRIVKPTSFIGGPGIYFDQRHHFTITALLDTSVCFIDLQVFKDILKGNQAFAEEFLKDFSRHVLTVYNRLIYLTQKQMPGRMADAILYLHDEIFNQAIFPMIISRSDLADLSAMSKESAVKILRDFQKENLLRISDHELEILDEEALRKISHIG
ncbi:MAG: Crp/Fnr family transcriptional regulator [Bacteroidales bacterium]|nr:Crp/Fnr family transcriptional regulator [Bacteroidales bacterium]